MGIYNAQGEYVGAVGYNIYEEYEGAEDVPQAIYNQIALGNDYRFDAQPKDNGGAYTPVSEREGGNNGYYRNHGCLHFASVAQSFEYESKEIIYKGVLSYNNDLLVYVAIELDSEKVNERDLTLIAESIEITKSYD